MHLDIATYLDQLIVYLMPVFNCLWVYFPDVLD